MLCKVTGLQSHDMQPPQANTWLSSLCSGNSYLSLFRSWASFIHSFHGILLDQVSSLPSLSSVEPGNFQVPKANSSPGNSSQQHFVLQPHLGSFHCNLCSPLSSVLNATLVSATCRFPVLHHFSCSQDLKLLLNGF